MMSSHAGTALRRRAAGDFAGRAPPLGLDVGVPEVCEASTVAAGDGSEVELAGDASVAVSPGRVSAGALRESVAAESVAAAEACGRRSCLEGRTSGWLGRAARGAVPGSR